MGDVERIETVDSIGIPYPLLFSPLNVGGITLKNRILMGSMHTMLEDIPGGEVRMAAYFAERARGGVGMITTGRNIAQRSRCALSGWRKAH